MRLIVIHLAQYVYNVIFTNTTENIGDILVSFFSAVLRIGCAFLHFRLLTSQLLSGCYSGQSNFS